MTMFRIFESEPVNYTVEQLKRWVKCRGLKQAGKREDLLARLSQERKPTQSRSLYRKWEMAGSENFAK